METRKLTQEGEEELLSHYRIIRDLEGKELGGVPVVDCRDGLTYRMLGEEMLKSNNRSKFINYNRYHLSPKKQQHVLP
jgi:hypothetical protein